MIMGGGSRKRGLERVQEDEESDGGVAGSGSSSDEDDESHKVTKKGVKRVS